MKTENSVSGRFTSVSTADKNYSFNCGVENERNDIVIDYNMGNNKALIEREDTVTGEKRRIVFNYLLP